MFEVENVQVDRPQCLMMGYGLDRTGLAVALFVGITLCVAIGVVGGILSHSMDIGFLLGCSSVTFLTAVQGTIFWIFG
jgi:hypothetical protein